MSLCASAVRWTAVAIATGVTLAFVAAAGATLRATAGHGYWADGYYRLLATSFWSRFDPWAAAAAGGAMLLAAGLRASGRLAAPPRPCTVRAAVALLTLVVAVRALAALDAWRVPRGPNLLLISIDTLRADRLGAYGERLPTSPVLDGRLAAEGVLFERCYSQSPKTTPSHMTLLTSLYPAVHGVELWEGGTPAAVLNPTVRTLADALKNAGYATAAFTGGGHVHRSRGFGQGFDVYRHGHELGRAVDWITAHRGRRFFVFFHTYQVHDPYVPPAPLIERFAPDYRGPVRDAVERLRAGLDGGWSAAHRVFWASVDAHDPGDVAFVSRLYDAGIRNMDDTTLTALLDALDRLGLSRETLVAFTSDHGEAFAEHGVFLHDDLYAGTLRVPLILRLPGRLPAGVRRPEPVRLIDVMPTVLSLLGVPAPTGLQGRSLVGLLDGRTDGEPVDVVSEYSHPRRIFQSVRRGSLTYIVDGSEEHLFDAAGDPSESRDVAAERPALLAGMRTALAGWREACRPLAARLGPSGPGIAPDADTVRQLRALGYVQ